MVADASPRGNPGPKIYQLLDPMYVTRGGPAPDREAVKDMGKDMGLDQEFPGFWGEVMTDFIQTNQDGVALFDN